MNKAKLSKEKITNQVTKELSKFIKQIRKKYHFVDGIQWNQYSSATIFCDGEDVPFSIMGMSILVKEENVLDRSLWEERSLYCYHEETVEGNFYRFPEGFAADLINPDENGNKEVCVVKHPDAQPYMKYSWKKDVGNFSTLTDDIQAMIKDFLGEDPNFFLFCLGDPVTVTLTEKGINIEEYQQ
jgi:hypothetical protein